MEHSYKLIIRQESVTMGRERQFEPYIDMESDGDNIHIGAYVGGVEIGFLDADIREDQILITNIYVEAEYRRQYVATDILNELVDFMYVEELHIPLSIDYILDDELSGLNAFLQSREDFVLIPNGEEYIISSDVWNNCSGSRHVEKVALAGVRIDRLLNSENSKAVEALMKKNLYMVPEGKNFADVYDSELSHMAFAGNEFKSGILARLVKDSEGKELVEVSVVICEPGSELWLVKLLSGFLVNMRNKYPDHSIRTFGVNEESINFVKKLFDGRAISKPGYSAVWMGI